MRNFKIRSLLLPKYYCGYQIKDEMGKTCSTHWSKEKCAKILLENLNVRDHLKGQGVDARMILRWILYN
jgi:hypothetical protein